MSTHTDSSFSLVRHTNVYYVLYYYFLMARCTFTKQQKHCKRRCLPTKIYNNHGKQQVCHTAQPSTVWHGIPSTLPIFEVTYDRRLAPRVSISRYNLIHVLKFPSSTSMTHAQHGALTETFKLFHLKTHVVVGRDDEPLPPVRIIDLTMTQNCLSVPLSYKQQSNLHTRINQARR